MWHRRSKSDRKNMSFLTTLCILAAVVLDLTHQVQGASCSCNCNDGGSSCPSNPSNNINNLIPKNSKSVKQCVFSSLNLETDNGPLSSVTCKFTKAESHTSLRVTFNGLLRVIGCSSGCCRRWFLTINGQECKDPATIDALVYATGSVNRHSPKTLDGFCNNIHMGEVTVGLSISKCSGAAAGNAYTGWNSVSRIVIEEVPPLQS